MECGRSCPPFSAQLSLSATLVVLALRELTLQGGEAVFYSRVDSVQTTAERAEKIGPRLFIVFDSKLICQMISFVFSHTLSSPLDW